LFDAQIGQSVGGRDAAGGTPHPLLEEHPREAVRLDVGLIDRPAQQVGGLGQVIFELEQREGRGRAGSGPGQQRGLRPPSSMLTVDSFAVQDPQARSRTSQPTDRNANFALGSLDR
jgi:hypothetical protein